MVDGKTRTAPSSRRFYCRYALSLTGGAIALALLQQAVFGSKDTRGAYVYDSERAQHETSLLAAPATELAENGPAAVIVGEDGRVLAVQQSSDSAAVIIEQVLDPVTDSGKLTEQDQQHAPDGAKARAEASIDLDALP